MLTTQIIHVNIQEIMWFKARLIDMLVPFASKRWEGCASIGSWRADVGKEATKIPRAKTADIVPKLGKTNTKRMINTNNIRYHSDSAYSNNSSSPVNSYNKSFYYTDYVHQGDSILLYQVLMTILVLLTVQGSDYSGLNK